MKRSGITFLALTTAAAAMLSGCAFGGGAQPAPTLSGDGDVSGSITVWSWDVAATALQRLAKDYESSHAGTTVDVIDVGYDNAYDKISVGMQAGTGLPDLITLETDQAPGYITQFPEGLIDLNPVIGSDKSDFDPFKWSAGSDADGRLRIAPWDSGTVALYYRTDYLAAAGVDPASLTTWEEAMAAGEKIKAATGHTLLSLDISVGGSFQMLLQQQGAGIFDADGQITVNSPTAVSTLTLLQQLNAKGLIKNVNGWDARVTSAKDGDSALTAEAVWWIGTLEGDAPELSGKYGVAPLPAFSSGGARTSNNGGSGLAIPSQAKNPQLAADFLKFALADADNQASMMEQEGLFPAYLPALQTSYFEQPQPYFGGQKVFELFAQLTATIPPVSFTSDQAKASDIVANAVVAVVLNGADPKTTLDDAAKQIATATGRKIAA